MKKYIFLAAAVLAMAACSKQNPAEESGTDTTSTEGRKVTLCVSAPEGSTKVAGTDNGDSFSFTWEEGDKILVGEGSGVADPQEFTLVTGAGTKNATFTGTMPEDYGMGFYIKYPVSDPDLNSQTYEEGKIASGLMKFYKSGITLDDEGKCNVVLEPKTAILQLNLFGIARSVNSIAVKAGSATYTLTCTDAVTVGKNKGNATPFYIVMDDNSVNAVQLQIDVDMNEGTLEASDLPDYLTYGKAYPISCKTFVQSESAATKIPAGTCVNMPAISLTTVWAPVNCGYDPVNFKYGKLYQWGRKDGSGYIDYDGKSEYDDAGGIVQTCPNPGYVTDPIAAENEDPSLYYNTTYIEGEGKSAVSKNTDWLATPDNTRWDATGGSEAVHFATKTKYDPCPEGWRVPTKAEMATLMGSNTSTDEFPISTHGSTSGITGRWFNASAEATPTTGVFLPVVGSRNSLNTAACSYRQITSATYWTSSVSDTQACSMGFGLSSKPSIATNSNRASGYSVRCVQE